MLSTDLVGKFISSNWLDPQKARASVSSVKGDSGLPQVVK
jgi:hypothetical protein